jgi:hypothetical protein
MIYEKERRESSYVSVNTLIGQPKNPALISSKPQAGVAPKEQGATTGGTSHLPTPSSSPAGNLEISKPSDPAELEADRVAEEINLTPRITQSSKLKNQPVMKAGTIHPKESTPRLPGGIHHLSGGSPLGDAERNFFEPRLGADFSGVKIHTDEHAAGMAEAINAKAFTKGNDIVFAKGEYQPGTGSGKRLMAHELTHVAQQNQSNGDRVNRKEDSGKEEPGILNNIFSAGTKGAAWVIENAPTINIVPVPGFEFMAKFMKGMMVGSLERLGREKVADLWRITQNVAKAVNSVEYMKAYFWGFLRGFFGDFIMIWELPGTIKNTVKFIENLTATIQSLSKEDLQGFAAKIDDIKAHIIEGGTEYINSIMEDIKAGKSSELIIETLQSITNFSLDAGKNVGGQLTGLMLGFFSKDHKELGKDLGSVIGELSGTVAFTALIAAITAGAGAAWGGVRAGIKTVTEIIGEGIGKAVKAVGAVFKRIGSVFEKLIDGARAFIKGFGKNASKLFKGIKGKLDEVLEKVKGLIDDVLGKLSGKTPDRIEPYSGVKMASQYLIDMGLPRNVRKEILEAFNVGTIKMEVAGNSTYGIRFYGGNARANGPYLFETFGQGSNRANMALPPQWNSMTAIQQWKIKPGTKYISGNAASQFSYGSVYVGGSKQYWIPNPKQNLILP